MFGIHDFGLFLATGILLNLTPGQDTFYIVARTLAEGRAIGIAAALGISAGTLLHTLAAALGVSAVLATSATAFLALKLAGAAYLVYLGATLLLGRRSSGDDRQMQAAGSMSIAFRQGMLTNVANPKVALFFLAFLPQFIDPESPQKIMAFLVLGGTFVATSTIWCIVLVVALSRLRRLVAAEGHTVMWLRRLAGACFVALGIRLAVSEA